MKTSRERARIRTPYTCIMPLLAKKAENPPLLCVLASFFFGALRAGLLTAFACRDMVVVLDFG